MMESKRLLFVARLGDGFVKKKRFLVQDDWFLFSHLGSPRWICWCFLFTHKNPSYCTFCCFLPQHIYWIFAFSRAKHTHHLLFLGNSHICNDHDSGRMVGVGANLLELWQTENYNTANLYLCHKHQQIKCIPDASCMDDLPAWKVKNGRFKGEV